MNRLTQTLTIGALTCAVLAVTVSIGGPFDIRLPDLGAPIEYFPPPEVETIAPLDPQFVGQEQNTPNSAAAKVLTALLGVILVILLAKGARYAYRMISQALGARDKTVRGASQILDEEPTTQILLPELHRAINVGRGHLARMTNSTDAIIAAWLALEAGAQEAGATRDLAQTPTEFTVAVLDQTPANPDITQELLGLYQLARFTTHELDPKLRDRAAEIMAQLEADFARPPATISTDREEQV